MRCEMQCVIHSATSHHLSSRFHIKPHFRHSTPYHISPHFTYFNTTRSHGVMWNSVVWNLVRCATFFNARCGMLCLIRVILIWLLCGIRCDVEYVRHGVMLCNVRYEKVVMRCGMMVWCMGNVVCCDTRFD